MIVESKFADGKRDTDLTGTTHGEKWVILETKHGAPKTSKKNKAADGLEADKAKKAKKANHPADEGTGEPPKKKRKKRREK